MLRVKQGSWVTPSAPDLFPTTDGWEKGEQPPSRGGSAGSPACPPTSLKADSCRGRIYLRALATFSCPVPLWRQRLPKEMPQMRNSSKTKQGLGGLWVRETER